MLNFKEFLEMAHITPRKNGQLDPIYVGGKYVQRMDMKFEKYPNTIGGNRTWQLPNGKILNTKQKLLLSYQPFYAKLPHESHFLFYDGEHFNVLPAETEDLKNKYPRLPDDWHEYAEFQYVDDSIKEPTKG